MDEDNAGRERLDPGPLRRALAVVGDRWTLALVDALQTGSTRFGDLEHALPGIAPNILSGRLGELERAGLITKAPYSTRPPRFVYHLTERGSDLAAVLASLTKWGAALAGAEGDIHHDACGTAIEWRSYCPTCDRIIDDNEASELAWA